MGDPAGDDEARYYAEGGEFIDDDPDGPPPAVEDVLDELSPELREAMGAAHSNWDRAGYVNRAEAVEEEHEPLLTPTGGTIHCEFCGDPIPSTRLAYRKIVGYEKQRRQGGTNAVRARKPTDDYACASCVDSIAAGRDPKQESVF